MSSVQKTGGARRRTFQVSKDTEPLVGHCVSDQSFDLSLVGYIGLNGRRFSTLHLDLRNGLFA